MAHYLLIAMALLAMLGVIFEEKIHVNKAKTALFFGTLSWVVLFIVADPGHQKGISAGLSENLTEIATLWLFLLAAMTFVAYLNKKGMIQNLIYLALPKKLSERKLMIFTALFCFLFSSLCDNITATLCSVALILSLKMPRDKTIKYCILVVFSVNSGGVALITGDVTTLMIFLADKVIIEDLLLLSIPAFVGVLVLASTLALTLKGDIEIEPQINEVSRVDITIGAIFLLTIVATIIGNVAFGIPPVLSFLFGLSVMFLTAHFFKEDIYEDPIMDYIRLIEFDTLMFFLGVLLVVGMLREIAVLDNVTALYSALPHEAANLAMGVLSAAIDNVPLTAALLKSDIEMSRVNWLMLTYSVGVGGSLLIIGSAAGIIAMSKVEGMTFGAYFRYLPHLGAAFVSGYGCVYLLGQVAFS